MAEIWKDAVGFEGYYEVSDLGNARRKGSSKNLKKILNKNGYYQQGFSVEGKTTVVWLHKIIAATFNGLCPVGQIVRHKDGNPLNNTPNNLLYGTNKDNTQDAIQHGTLAKGTKHGMSKLTDQQVRDIRASSLSYKALMAQYGVSKSLIHQVKTEKIWKHI